MNKSFLIFILILICVLVADSLVVKNKNLYASVLSNLETTKILGISSYADDPKKTESLENLISQRKGIYSVYIKNLDNGTSYEYNSDHKYYGASLYKLLVAVSVFHKIDTGELQLDQYISNRFSISDLLNAMLKQSDNPSQSILTALVGENQLYKDFSVVLSTKSDFPINNKTSSKEVGTYLEQVYKKNFLSVDSKINFLDIMTQTSFDNRISAGLEQKAIFSHKIGNWSKTGTWHDCGLFFGEDAIVVCLMSEGTTFENFLEVAKEVGILVSSFK